MKILGDADLLEAHALGELCVALLIGALEVRHETAALGDHLEESNTGAVVLAVLL